MCAGVGVAARCAVRLARSGPVPEPADLPLRIRVAVSQERARSRRSVFTVVGFGLEKHCGSVPASGRRGLCQCRAAAGHHRFAGYHVRQAGDGAGHARRASGKRHRPSSALFLQCARRQQTGAIDSPVVVEAYVNDEGEVYDYRIVSGPDDANTRSQVENLLLFSRFEPARFFGQPVRGLAVLSFSGVSVRGLKQGKRE